MDRAHWAIRLLYLGALVALPAAAVAGDSALEAGRTIVGTIRLEGGVTPHHRARVRLFNSAASPQDEIFAETSGRFIFNGLPAGEYMVEVLLIGFETARQPVV